VFGDSDTLKIVAETSKETDVSNQVMEELYQNSNNGGLWVEIYGPKNPPLNEIVNYAVFLKYAPELESGMLYFAYPDSHVKTYPLPDFLRKKTVNNVEKWTSYKIADRLDVSELNDVVINTAMSTFTVIPFVWELISRQLPSMPIPPRNLYFDGVFYNDNDFDKLIIPFPVGADEPVVPVPLDKEALGLKDITPPADLVQMGPDNSLCFIVPTKFTDNRPALLDFFIATKNQRDPKDFLPYKYRQTGEITIWIHPTGVNDKTEETFDGIAAQITDVTWPPEDIHDITIPIPVDVDFSNIGSQAQSFWIGYSVQDSTGKWWDAPPRQAVGTKPGESGTIQLQWLPPETAPQGAYTAKVVLWEGRNFDTDLMEGEFDSRTKENAFQLNPRQTANVPQDQATTESSLANSAKEWTTRGNILYLHGQRSEAMQCYDKAIELDSRYMLAWNRKGQVLSEIDDKKDCWNKALEIANKKLEANSIDGDAWYNKGFALIGLDKYDEALQASNKAIEIDPQNAMAWINEAYVLFRLGKYDEALQASNKAIEIDPQNAMAWSNKAGSLHRLGKYDEALQASNKAIEIDPQIAVAWSNKAGSLLRLGKYDEALQASNKAIEIDPQIAVAWSNKAIALCGLGGRTTESEAAETKAKELGYGG